MEIYKLANKEKLRFSTSKGILTAEQLWDLNLQDLDNLAVSLEEVHKTSGKKSFLTKVSAKDKTTKLRFDIVLDVLNTKVEEDQIALELKENKEHNKKIISLISEKKDETLKTKSIKELEKMLK